MKPKIYATGNQNLNGEYNVSYYIIEKNELFLDWLSKLVEEIFEIEESSVKFVKKDFQDSKGFYSGSEIYIKDINKMIDVHEKYESRNTKDRIDVFYGKERVYLTLRKSKEVRKKFADFLKKTREWIKIENPNEKQTYLKMHKKLKV